MAVTIRAMKLTDVGLIDFTALGLQAALDYVGLGGGGQIYIGPGTIALTNVLSIYSNTWLCGAANGGTILQRTVGSVNVIQNKTFVGTADHDILITDMILDGNVSGGVGGHCLRFTNVLRGTIERCRLVNPLSTGVGIYGSSAGPGINQDIKIRDNIFDTTLDSGIDFTDCIGGEISWNRFYNISQTGINVEPRNVGGVVEYVKGLRVTGNYYDVPSASGAGIGIHLQGYSFGTYDGTIETTIVSDNVIKAAKTTGIRLEGNNNLACKATGNIVKSCGNQGILVKGGSGVGKYMTVSGNDVINCSTSGVAAYSGIELANCQNCVCVDNMVFDTNGTANHKYGIEESSGSNTNFLDDNEVLGSSVGDVAPLGTTHSTRKTFGLHEHYGDFRTRNEGTQRYRADFFRTGTALNLIAFDDTAAINHPVKVQTLAVVKFSLVDAATIAVDASLGNMASVTLAGNRTVGLPTNAATGQRMTFVITQDGTGGRTLTWNANFKQAWSDTGNTASKVSMISFIYDSFWYQDGAQTPYI